MKLKNEYFSDNSAGCALCKYLTYEYKNIKSAQAEEKDFFYSNKSYDDQAREELLWLWRREKKSISHK